MDNIIRLIKKIKIKNLIILILLLAFNTYAWFVYTSKVTMDLNVNVSSWNVEFKGGTGEETSNMTINIDRIFPGMDRFEKSIEVHNKGETNVNLTYEIKELNIMGETYVVNSKTDYTTESIEEMIKTKYPFKIEISKDSDEILTEDKKGYFNISLEWPFESGDDELDTYWGTKAYDYYALNKDKPCIELIIELVATQSND